MEKYLALNDGMMLKYDVSGEGPAMILMHGWGYSNQGASPLSLSCIRATSRTGVRGRHRFT